MPDLFEHDVVERKALRDYQINAIENLRNSLRTGHKRPVLQSPTGSGKTILSAGIVDLALAKSKRIAFCVPRISLVDQTVEMFGSEGITEVGVVQGSHPLEDWSKPIQICSVATLARRTFPNVDMAIIDECHIRSKVVEAWMSDRPTMPFIGLSATPYTKGLGHVYDDLVVVATTKQMQEQGYLCKERYFAPSIPDMSGVKIVAGDYHEGQSSEVMRQTKLIGDTIESWLKYGDGLPTFVFGVDCAHARALHERFLKAGIAAAYQDGDTPDDERARIKREYHRGSIKVVCSVGTMLMGVDWDVRCISWCRPTKSEIVWQQAIGRGLRTAPGKDCCVILDHAGTALKLGLASDIHHDHLSGHKLRNGGEPKERDAPLPKQCPECFALRPPGVLKCPACGFEVSPPRSKIENAPGELVEMSKTQKKRHSQDGLALQGVWYSSGQFYSEMLGYAAERGYRSGWASQKYREVFGVWPNKWRNMTASYPTPPVRSWILAKNIAWAKRRSRQEAAD